MGPFCSGYTPVVTTRDAVPGFYLRRLVQGAVGGVADGSSHFATEGADEYARCAGARTFFDRANWMGEKWGGLGHVFRVNIFALGLPPRGKPSTSSTAADRSGASRQSNPSGFGA